MFNIFKRKHKVAELENRNENDGFASGALSMLRYAGQAHAQSLSAFYCGLELISNSIAELPIYVKHRDEILHDHPVNSVFRNGIMPKFNLIKQLVWDMYVRGNGFIYIKRFRDGTPRELIYCPNDDVTVSYTVGKQRRELYYYVPSVRSGRIEPVDMIHVRKNTFDGVNGISILSYASRTLDISNATESAASGFYKSGCNIAGILKASAPLSDKQRKDIRDNWRMTHANEGNAVAVLPGNMDYQAVGVSAKDAQMIESRQFNISEIARFFNINPVLLGDLSHSSYSTIEAAQIEFVTHTLLPLITLIQEEFNRKLLKPSESSLRIDLDENYLLKSDKTAEANYYKTLTGAGILSINEARQKLGFAPIENGDAHLIPYTNIADNTVENSENSDEKNIVTEE